MITLANPTHGQGLNLFGSSSGLPTSHENENSEIKQFILDTSVNAIKSTVPITTNTNINTTTTIINNDTAIKTPVQPIEDYIDEESDDEDNEDDEENDNTVPTTPRIYADKYIRDELLDLISFIKNEKSQKPKENVKVHDIIL
ncbi:hypothetical protein DLAC_04094 [Tieghemostelium lacteum]|uniref:Uncharacterized protein n=1 Tax=Tieghemostelium lacteum TaxID=361077 RepID=A0A151ZS20_TIELA|nr:hypothetical protein DLAC_04094 [Tieghemostelium lacteum]|eukprot:KYQ96793.1 hypothetical protein DLAC_04094 [Tieghemostelium lacteum]